MSEHLDPPGPSPSEAGRERRARASRTFGELARRVLDAPARLGGVRLVAVDGGTGSGKTTFAGRLARALSEAACRVEVVHTDDLLDGWDDQFTFWTRLEETVLAPLRAGRPASYPVYDWYARAFTSERALPVPDVLVLDGVSTARQAGAADRTLAIFLDLDPEARLKRALTRDSGLGVEARLRLWVQRELWWFAVDRTVDHVDLVVDAFATGEDHPEGEYQHGEADRG